MGPTASQFWCCDCERDFKDENALLNHVRSAKTHNPKLFRCGDCGRAFKTEGRLNDHFHAKGHKRPEVRCNKCSRTFKNESAKKAHMESVRHNPLSNIKCLAGNGCNKTFKCPSAQLQHLESGRCKSGMTKAELDAAIAANDPEGKITTRRTTIAPLSTTSTSTSPLQSPILTPASSEYFGSYPPSGAVTPTSSTSIVVPIMDMHMQQRCPLCPARRTRMFTPHALRSHLASKIHRHDHLQQQNHQENQIPSQLPLPSLSLFTPKAEPEEVIIFHCPQALLDITGAGTGTKQRSSSSYKEFASIGALAQHLESGACEGGAGAFRLVVEYVQQELRHLGFGGLKLLR